MSSATVDKTENDLIDMLEAQPIRPDPTDPTKTLPARPGAVIIAADEFGGILTALQVLCRKAGTDCTYVNQLSLKYLNGFLQKKSCP